MFYALAPWRQIVDDSGEVILVSPASSPAGVIDLGARTGTPLGLFASRESGFGRDALNLGDNLGALPDKETLSALLKLGERIVGVTLADILEELVTVAADPTGVERVRPLRPTSKGQLELYLGGLIMSRRFDVSTDPAWPTIRTAIQEDVKRARAAGIIKGDSTYLKYLATLEEKFKQPYTDFLAAGVPDEGTIRPETTVTDPFSATTNWTDLAGDLKIVSGRGESNLTDGTTWFGQYNTPLSTDDMYAQVAATLTSGTGTRNAGALARFYDNAGSLDRYWGRCDFNTGPVFDIKCDKRVSGVNSTIIASTSPSYSAGALIKVQADGTTIRLYYNGVESTNSPVVDADISGIFTAGATVRYPSAGTSSHAQVDNFEAADLATAYTPRMTLLGVG